MSFPQTEKIISTLQSELESSLQIQKDLLQQLLAHQQTQLLIKSLYAENLNISTKQEQMNLIPIIEKQKMRLKVDSTSIFRHAVNLKELSNNLDLELHNLKAKVHKLESLGVLKMVKSNKQIQQSFKELNEANRSYQEEKKQFLHLTCEKFISYCGAKEVKSMKLALQHKNQQNWDEQISKIE
ncbi:hypothetical protein SS50377_20384 [Spironucleus salmonicida]|uniref:Uncharacterized protein n=1 Tax=Spironucleus salmonicida TaxID=348837 RepID=V6LXX4_9EUKA|nr:hypothetical protein SS50377_20384 [Spironucleus salmonicida]|eukprot:EST49103.1 Hypothetical protein SS50377_10621 [Spironucleus salmonicida]